MRSLTAAAIAVFILSGCASGGSGASLINPELAMMRVGGQSNSTQNVAGGLPVHIRTSIRNPSGEAIRLNRINLTSIGEGGVTIPNTSRSFNIEIPANETRTFEFWVSGFVSELSARSPIGSNTPINVRVTAVFSSPFGQFQEVYMEQLGFSDGQVVN